MTNNVDKIENLIAQIVDADPDAANRNFVSPGRGMGQSILWGAAHAYVTALADLMRITDPNDDYFGGEDPESVQRRRDAQARAEKRALWSETYLAWASQYHDAGHKKATTAEDIVNRFSQPMDDRRVRVTKSMAEEHMELWGFGSVEEAEEDLVALKAPTQTQKEIQAKRCALIKANRDSLVKQLAIYLGKGHAMPLNDFEIPAGIAAGICRKIVAKLLEPVDGHLTRVRRRGAQSYLRREKLAAAALGHVLIAVANEADELGSFFTSEAENQQNPFEIHTAQEEADAHRNIA
jgi:hypothetical protein